METSALSRLEIPSVLHGHIAYVESLNKITVCLSELAKHEGAAVGISAKRLRNMLAAIAVHLRDNGSCALCQNAGSGGLRRFEDAFMNAYAAYRGSPHAKSSSSLERVAILVAAEDRIDSDSELLLLPACLDLLRAKLGLAAEQAA